MAYIKTQLGQLAFKERSPLMSNRQRSLFLLIDGVKSVDQVLTITRALSITQADIDYLVVNGFVASDGSVSAVTESAIAPVNTSQPSGIPAALDGEGVAATPQTHQVRFARAWPIATQLTAGMGMRGFRLNLAIEAASGYDDLLALLPKIQAAIGKEKCISLEHALKG